ncbi:50S ribosomal protein L1 [Sarcoptes scabiei]|nr:50S ribosomal protein L1 [Sarcoptes scabiei]
MLQNNCIHFHNAVRKVFFHNHLPSSTSILSVYKDILVEQKRFAKRRGKRIALTREKQRLARERRAAEADKPKEEWKSPNLRIDRSLKYVSKKFNDDDRKSLHEIVDNVFVFDHYKEIKYPLLEALNFLRETQTPEMYDEPDAVVNAKIEMDLRTKKKTKFIGKFQGIVCYPNLFDYSSKRKVIAICSNDEDERVALKAGAELAGTRDVIQMIKNGDITLFNFDELVCHGDMLIELATIKNILGQYFPTQIRGNIGFDMSRLVRYFVNGIEFKNQKDEIEPDYGFVIVPFGRLNQTDNELNENFSTLLKNIDGHRPTDISKFITRVVISAEPSPEKFAIKFWNHIDGYKDQSVLIGNNEMKKSVAVE